MATIEPRLIHLLNDATTPQLSSTDLPPIQAPNGPQSNDDRPLPLEPDAGRQADKPVRNIQSSANPVLPLYQPDDGSVLRGGRLDSRYNAVDRPAPPTGLGTTISSYPLRLLLSETSAPESSNSLSRILSDGVEGSEDLSNKKRHRGLAVKDDLVQLPQPIKKQKATQQQVMPPIINGLLEPPPDAALFPPISSTSFNENDASQMKLLREFATNAEDRTYAAQQIDASKSAAGKARRRAAKPRRKWTETETNHLLLGVNRHGVGKWTNILEDPDFRFNDRTAGDLKDRFRTCCPEELRADLPSAFNTNEAGATSSSPKAPAAQPKHKAKTGLLSENILIESEEESPSNTPTPQPQLQEAESSPKPKRSRAHRKKLEDLAELGIHGPFKKSRRRERRPFTEQDDKEILEGLDIYGPAWTKIQRDPRFSLSSRQPTDLRDRVRNKYPNIYSRIEKGVFQIKDPTRGNDLLEPSVNMVIENSFPSTKPAAGPLSHHLHQTGSREELPKWPGTASGFDIHETTTTAQPATNTGEMDISRFLLDNPSDMRPDVRLPLPAPLSRSVSPANGLAVGPRRDRSPGHR